MPSKVVQVLASPAPTDPRRPDTFSGETAGVIVPPGVQGLYKVTGRDRPGPGTYLTTRRPSTRESARRRLDLPDPNPADQTREYRTVEPLSGTIGQVAGGSAGDLQIEVKNPECLEEVRRWYLPFDSEVRWKDALIGAAAVGLAGLAIGYRYGRALLGLAIGVILGLIIGLLFPTDPTEFTRIIFGVARVSFAFALA